MEGDSESAGRRRRSHRHRRTSIKYQLTNRYIGYFTPTKTISNYKKNNFASNSVPPTDHLFAQNVPSD